MKGLLFVVEVTLAILMMFFIAVLIFSYLSPVRKLDVLNYKLKAYEGLNALEETGKLRRYAINDDVNSIKNDINQFIPDFISYDVVLYNETTNITSISSQIEKQKDVISISYLLAGNFDNYKLRDVRVFMWGFD